MESRQTEPYLGRLIDTGVAGLVYVDPGVVRPLTGSLAKASAKNLLEIEALKAAFLPHDESYQLSS